MQSQHFTKIACGIVGLGLLIGCTAPSKATRIQEAAYDLNMGARFARMDIAMGKVAEAHRKQFAKRHREWHHTVRIVDVELAGMNMNKKGDAEILINIGWQRVNEPYMRATVVSQTWRDFHGKWLMVAEKVARGSGGLFGEAPTKTPGPMEKGLGNSPQFRTKTIAGDSLSFR